jgi:hypothetical protein
LEKATLGGVKLNIIDLDKKIIELSQEYKTLDSEYVQVTDEIEDLEYRQESLECRMNDIEEEIKEIKELMLSKMVEQLNIETDDPFLKDFITASYFCDKDTRPVLCNVNITEDELQACDGYRAIIIKNTNIPINLKNTKIKWDIRESFEENINNTDKEFINLKTAYPDKSTFTFKLEGLTSEDFYQKLNVDEPEEIDTCERVIIHAGEDICVNKEYMDSGLLAFKNEEFTLYASTKIAPIVLENERKSVIILPLRLL